MTETPESPAETMRKMRLPGAHEIIQLVEKKIITIPEARALLFQKPIDVDPNSLPTTTDPSSRATGLDLLKQAVVLLEQR